MLKEQFASNLKKLRKSRKFTQEKLAELVGVDFRYISFLENAKNFPSCELIERLAKALNVSYEDFFISENNENRKQIEIEISNLLKQLNDNRLNIVYKLIKDLIFSE